MTFRDGDLVQIVSGSSVPSYAGLRCIVGAGEIQRTHLDETDKTWLTPIEDRPGGDGRFPFLWPTADLTWAEPAPVDDPVALRRWLDS